jgi:hypothetical protein
MLDIMARRPFEKIKDINDSKSLWRIAVRVKDLWIVRHGKSLNQHIEMVASDELVIQYSVCMYIHKYIK